MRPGFARKSAAATVAREIQASSAVHALNDVHGTRRDKLDRLLFPNPPRTFPRRRACRLLLRAIHVLAAAAIVGGTLTGSASALLAPWLLATVASGLLLLGLDIHANAVVVLEVRGLAMLGKLALLALAAVVPPLHLPVLVMVLMLSVVVSHLPREHRHRVLIGAGRNPRQ